MRIKEIEVMRFLPLPTPIAFDDKLSPSDKRKFMFYLCIAGAVLCLSGSIYYLVWGSPKEIADYGGSGIIVLFAIFLIFSGTQFLQGGVPKGLEAFEDDF